MALKVFLVCIAAWMFLVMLAGLHPALERLGWFLWVLALLSAIAGVFGY